jgi:hypothetical protein
MIRISLHVVPSLMVNRQADPGRVYTIRHDNAALTTTDPTAAAAHLRELGVEDPGLLIERARHWREIEVPEPIK